MRFFVLCIMVRSALPSFATEEEKRNQKDRFQKRYDRLENKLGKKTMKRIEITVIILFFFSLLGLFLALATGDGFYQVLFLMILLILAGGGAFIIHPDRDLKIGKKQCSGQSNSPSKSLFSC